MATRVNNAGRRKNNKIPLFFHLLSFLHIPSCPHHHHHPFLSGMGINYVHSWDIVNTTQGKKMQILILNTIDFSNTTLPTISPPNHHASPWSIRFPVYTAKLAAALTASESIGKAPCCPRHNYSHPKQ